MKGFNSQELNIFLPFNSTSVTEGPCWSAALGFGGVQRAQSLTVLKPPLVRGTEINCGKFCVSLKPYDVPLKPYDVSYSRALACLGHNDTEDDAAMGMDTRLGQHRRHQRGNFHI